MTPPRMDAMDTERLNDIAEAVARIDERTKEMDNYVRRKEFDVYVWLIRFMAVTEVGLLIDLAMRRVGTP